MTSRKFTIHDVEHGQLVTLSLNGQLWMWDCGATTDRAPHRIAQTEGNGVVDLLFITNYDEDHLRGLPSLRLNAIISRLARNKSIDASQLRRIKETDGNPISFAMKSMIEMIGRYTNPADPAKYPSIPGVSYSTFHNSFPQDAVDTNNLSLVTVLEVSGVKIIISGDLESEGWETLLQNTSIAKHLAHTDIFIASHHGRENGYHDDVMKIAAPSCVVMSDYEVKHSTQENMVARYSRHASGVNFKGQKRKVLTTRSDGSITWKL